MNDLEKEIESYLNREMTPEQRFAFEKKINTDPQLQKDINTYSEMHAFYDDADWNLADVATKNKTTIGYEAFLTGEKGKSIADSIKNAENQYFKNKSSSGPKLLWIRYAAAIAAILVIAFLVISQFDTHINSKDLYASYKNWDELPSLTLRDGNTELATAEKLFRQQKYAEALEVFTTYQSKNTKELNPQVLIYTGIAQLELNQYKAALHSFEQLLQSNTLDAPKAQWYLALTYLKMDNLSKTKEALKIISKNPKNSHYNNANELLRKLE